MMPRLRSKRPKITALHLFFESGSGFSFANRRSLRLATLLLFSGTDMRPKACGPVRGFTMGPL
jgi:hypothetical protein